jgi:hypothetical protein
MSIDSAITCSTLTVLVKQGRLTACLKVSDWLPNAPLSFRSCGVREARIEKYFCDEVRNHGGSTRKCVWPGHNGCPDRIALWPGRLDWVELKRPLTPDAEDHQKREHNKLRAAGQLVFVLPSKIDVDEYIRLRSTEL